MAACDQAPHKAMYQLGMHSILMTPVTEKAKGHLLVPKAELKTILIVLAGPSPLAAQGGDQLLHLGQPGK